MEIEWKKFKGIPAIQVAEPNQLALKLLRSSSEIATRKRHYFHPHTRYLVLLCCYALPNFQHGLTIIKSQF